MQLIELRQIQGQRCQIRRGMTAGDSCRERQRDSGLGQRTTDTVERPNNAIENEVESVLRILPLQLGVH
jgi:hypothetical protein